MMLRFLTSMPAGKLRFTIIDPAGLGENFAAFMHLADYDEQLVASRIWTDPKQIDEQILKALPPLVEEHRAKIGRFVEDQINGWQEKKLVQELERHIGPDLQYIRINGTLVGGLAGLLIAALTQLAH